MQSKGTDVRAKMGIGVEGSKCNGGEKSGEEERIEGRARNSNEIVSQIYSDGAPYSQVPPARSLARSHGVTHHPLTILHIDLISQNDKREVLRIVRIRLN